MNPKLVLDWDGTCTEVDSLHMILERFGDRVVYEQMEGVLGDGLTLHEVIAAEIGTVTLPLEQGIPWVREHVTVRDGFHELAELHRPVIVSSGFRELIEPVLEREGIQLKVLANSLEARPDGWRPVWRDEVICPICGEACKRGVLVGEPYVYVGDALNDAPMFAGFERSVGVANIKRWWEELTHKPGFLTEAEEGAGLREVIKHILALTR